MPFTFRVAFVLLSLLGLSPPACAAERILDVVQVSDRVFALVGPTGPRTYENHGLNANFGVVVTDAGVALIDSGASDSGARIIEQHVASITDQPVRWVINTGSQDHRWLGNGYFKAKGAEIIALERTVRTQRQFAAQHLEGLAKVLRERGEGTRPTYAAHPLPGERERLNLGGVPMELRWFGDAHFPGDAVVWLPQQQVAFSGDLVYVDRILGVHPWSNVSSWREAFADFAALSPQRIVPGHGSVCDLDKAQRETGDYLAWLVSEVGAAVEEWEPLAETVARLAEAPAFAQLQHFESWHRTNVNRTYLQLESRQASP